MAEFKEEHSRLLQCHFEAELRSLEQLDKAEDQNKQLQEDCTEKISSISLGERSESRLCLCLVFCV